MSLFDSAVTQTLKSSNVIIAEDTNKAGLVQQAVEEIASAPFLMDLRMVIVDSWILLQAFRFLCWGCCQVEAFTRQSWHRLPFCH